MTINEFLDLLEETDHVFAVEDVVDDQRYWYFRRMSELRSQFGEYDIFAVSIVDDLITIYIEILD